MRGRRGSEDGFDYSHRSRRLSWSTEYPERLAPRATIRARGSRRAGWRDIRRDDRSNRLLRVIASKELRSCLRSATPGGALARGSRVGDARERRGVLDGRGGVARGSRGFPRRRRRARVDRARRHRRPRNPPPPAMAMPSFSNDRFPRGTRARARGRRGGRQARALARGRGGVRLVAMRRRARAGTPGRDGTRVSVVRDAPRGWLGGRRAGLARLSRDRPGPPARVALGRRARVAPLTPAAPTPSPRLSRFRLRRRQGQGPRVHG